MTKQQTDYLFQLIKSLSKSEKRSFKLYVNRISASEQTKFLQIFDVLDKLNEYNEKIILKKAPNIKPTQLSNLKAHLYKQILISLRLTHLNQDIDLTIREQIDYAKVLYNKALYKQSLKILDKVKVTAIKHKRTTLHYEIIEFERLIEGQFITRSIETRAEELSNEATKTSEKIAYSNTFSNLALNLYSLYLKVGYVRNEKDLIMVKGFFDTHLKSYDIDKLGFYEKLYLYQSYVWYYNIVQDFLMCYKYSQKWVDLFSKHPDIIYIQSDLYLKGIHNLLSALFLINHYDKFTITLNHLIEIEENKLVQTNNNNKRLLFLYTYSHLLNKHFMEGSFSEGLELVPKIENHLKEFSHSIDIYRILVFYYKIACLYFGSGDYKSSIKYLNKIINSKDVQLRGDIHCFSRILNLICHFELNNQDFLDYQVKSTFRFLAKMDDLHLVQKYILDFLRKLSYISADDLKTNFIKLKNKLVKLVDDPFEKRAFLYLDLISWLESKIEKKSVQEIIQNKFKQNHR